MRKKKKVLAPPSLPGKKRSKTPSIGDAGSNLPTEGVQEQLKQINLNYQKKGGQSIMGNI